MSGSYPGRGRKSAPGSTEGPGAPEDGAHVPVMVAEVLEVLAPAPGGVHLDATVGLGGHAAAFLERIGPAGILIGIDRDPAALAVARARLEAFCRERGWPAEAIRLEQAPFAEAGAVLDRLGVEVLDTCLFDLGVSSLQLDDAARGFSFRSDAPLDMRMDPTTGPTAAELLAEVDEAELARMLFDYGEERHARRIARRIATRRSRGPILRTAELAELIAGAYPPDERGGRIHPATRTFQALRIAVNRELEQIEPALIAVCRRLRPGGRVAVLAYHSLEDRIVKRTLDRLSGRCDCPPGLPVCACGAERIVRPIERKPGRPGGAEVAANPRSRSARLRAAERVGEAKDGMRIRDRSGGARML